MTKREFLQVAGMAATAAAVDGVTLGELKAGARTNWSGNYVYSTDRLLRPATVAEVQGEVRATRGLRVLGSRHSFNGIADSTVEQVSVESMKGMELDRAARTVTVGGGVRYGELAPWLDARGFALHNLASLPHITVAGACSTGTHGSGVRNGNLATAVRGLEVVDGRGRVVALGPGDPRLAGAVVGLGVMGAVTRVTLAVEPTFEMRQVVYLSLPFAELERNFDAVMGAGYSVSLFTDWQGGQATQVWIKSKVEPGKAFAMAPEFFGAKLATRKMHPILDHPAEFTTDQMGVPGPWYERMPHFLMRFTPSSGQELQTEYFVPREQGMAAIRAVEGMRDEIAPHLFISEVRTIGADELWMSMAYRRDSVALHFTWKPEWEAVRPILPKIEARLEPFGVRPHWAKLFTMSPGVVAGRYARMGEFRALAGEMDPEGRFRNAFAERYVFGRG